MIFGVLKVVLHAICLGCTYARLIILLLINLIKITSLTVIVIANDFFTFENRDFHTQLFMPEFLVRF